MPHADLTPVIRVFSDYVCPFCFIAEKPLKDAVAAVGGGVDIEWMPFELRPEPTPTLRPEDRYLQTVWPQSVYPLAAHYGVKMVLPRVSPQPYTRLAFEGSLFARDHGRAEAYNHRMFSAFFQEERDIGQVAVLSELAGELGLDPKAFRHALETGAYRAEHQARLAEAARLSIQSVPTILIGGYLLQGVQPAGVLEEVLREVFG